MKNLDSPAERDSELNTVLGEYAQWCYNEGKAEWVPKYTILAFQLRFRPLVLERRARANQSSGKNLPRGPTRILRRLEKETLFELGDLVSPGISLGTAPAAAVQYDIEGRRGEFS